MRNFGADSRRDGSESGMSRDTPRKPLRLQGYDYARNGCYFVTVCTRDRYEYFSEIIVPKHIGAVINDRPVKTGPYIKLSPCGEIVERELIRLYERYTGFMRIDKYIVMPNHIHMIIALHHHYVGAGLDPPIDPPIGTTPSLSQIIGLYKSGVSRLCNISDCSMFWQRSFYDEIIRDDVHYQNVWQYIDNNLAQWAEDEYYHA